MGPTFIHSLSPNYFFLFELTLMSSSSATSSSARGKAKSKTSPTSAKRPLTLEDQISSVESKIGRHKNILRDCQTKIDDLRVKLKKKQKLDAFMDVMTSDACLICKNNLSDCIGEPDMALVSYKCACSRVRLVHLGCFIQEFKCSCGEFAKLAVKSSSGKDVNVAVSEVVSVSPSDDGLGIDSDNDFN